MYQKGIVELTGCSQLLLEIYSPNCRATTVQAFGEGAVNGTVKGQDLVTGVGEPSDAVAEV